MTDILWSLIIPLAIILVCNIALFVLIKIKALQRLKLKKNLIIVLLVVTLVPLFTNGYVSHRKMSSVLLNNVCEDLRSIGRTRALFIDEKLEEAKIDTETIAKNWIVMEVLRQISLEKTNKTDPNFSTLFKNAQGHLGRIASTKGYDDIMLISADGKIELTCDEHLGEVGLDVSSEHCFKEGKEKTHFTSLFYNKFAGKNLMYITTPCFDMQGRFAGCVILEVGMKRIYNVLVDREGLGETGESYLVDREKFMLSESRFIKDAVLRVKVDTFGVNEGLGGKTGVTVYPDYRNTPVFGSWHPIKYTNWVLIVEKDEAEAFAPLWANQIHHIILISVTVIMVVFIAIFSARATVKPVQELITISEYIREGKLDKDVKIQCYDEIGLLINVFNKSIRDMRLLAEQAMVISRGDLTVNIETKGDLAGAFVKMLESLRTLIKQTQESITRLSSVSMEMLSSTEEQASGSAELAASVGEITATVEELSSSAKQVATNAESVAKIAEDSEATGHQGREAISSSIHIMEEIKATTKDSMKKVASFSEKSQKIGDVLGMIKGIASETHLLALNASIEASSAGEFGKRFGVVAGEVRRLAERTKTYAEEIKNVVSEIQVSTNAAVLSIEQNVRNVDKGVDVIREVGQAIESNLGFIEKTSGASRQIVMATQQQRSATEQVAVTMREIAEVVKQTAAGLKQSAAAVTELNTLADELKETVKHFKA